MSDDLCNLYRPVSWGLVSRYNERAKTPEILVAERSKPGDERRTSQLVFPGGGLEGAENFTQAAEREVYQETGIFSRAEKVLRFRNNGIIYVLSDSGQETAMGYYDDLRQEVFLGYLDTGKMYRGKVVFCWPEDSTQKPTEQSESDAKNPHYILLENVITGKKQFTPACQILIDLIFSQS